MLSVGKARVWLVAALVASSAVGAMGREKPRVFVLTDIENEPDDAMSLVRLMTHANDVDIEGLTATTSTHLRDRIAPDRIREIVTAYGKVQPNLLLHAPGYPPAEELLSRVYDGRPVYGMQGVGEGNDSQGSEELIKAVDAAAARGDKRPLWVTVWGGPNVLAQALWKVRKTRSAEELNQFVSGLRVYTISDQDDSGPWLREQFPGLFFVASPGVHFGGGYHYGTWNGISGDYFHGRFSGADFSLVTNEWLEEHIRSKGPLGAEYPEWEYLMEGDTPSFLNLVDNGLANPERPDWGGWGGRYEFYTPRMQKWFAQPETRPFWNNCEDEVLGVDGRWQSSEQATIWRWRPAYQNEFAARMDWTIKPYDEANHPPVVKLAHADRMTARIGDRVELSAAGTTDPDGDPLTYDWYCYNEAGTFCTSANSSGQPVEIENHDQAEATLIVPSGRVMPPGTGTLHIILAVTDQATPPMTRYRRVIVDVVK